MTSKLQFVLCFLCVLLMGSMAEAQVRNSGAQSVALFAVLGDSIKISLSTNSVNFNLTEGTATNAGSNGVTATTSWVSKPGRNISVYAYFFSSTAALTNGGTGQIPSADFSISNNGGAYTPLTNTVAFGAANAGVRLSTVRIIGSNKTGSHADNMLFNIDLSTVTGLPAGPYTGTLNIQAQII